LDTDPAGLGDSDDPVVVIDGMNVCVVWKDTRSGLRDIRLNHSADGGATWQLADSRLDTDAAGSSDSDEHRIRIQGTDVFVVWEDDRNGNHDIFMNRSTDGGATWLGADVRIDSGAGTSLGPVVSSSGLDVHVAWRDDRNGDYDIYYNHSADGGVTWQANDLRLDSDASGVDSQEVEIAVDGVNVYVCYKDQRNGGGDDDVFINVSNDAGATWLPSDMRLDTGNGDSDGPRICADAGNVYVCWEDTKAGLDDVYLRYSTDAGATWIPAELYAESPPAGSFDSSGQRMSCSGNAVWIVWHEDRNGDLDVFVNGGVLP
jgi:hypothetical protein